MPGLARLGRAWRLLFTAARGPRLRWNGVVLGCAWLGLDHVWLYQGHAWLCIAVNGWLLGSAGALPGCTAVLAVPGCAGPAWAAPGLDWGGAWLCLGCAWAGFGLCPDAAGDHHWSTLSTGGGVGDHRNVKVVLDDDPRHHQHVKVEISLNSSFEKQKREVKQSKLENTP